MANDIKPIKNDADLDAALREVERLWEAKPGTPDRDRLAILSTLIEAYEDKHYPFDPPDPVEAIKFRMEQQGLEPKDLEPAIGSPEQVSAVLAGKRSLTITMIRRLHEQLGISADVLIRAPRKGVAAE